MDFETCTCGNPGNETGLCDKCAATIDEIAADNDCVDDDCYDCGDIFDVE